MSDDLVQRLRYPIAHKTYHELQMEAADRIEELEKTIEHWFLKANDYSMKNIALEEALKRIAECSVRRGNFAYELQQIARRALEAKP